MPAGDESLCGLQGARDDFGVDAACCESEVMAMNPRLYFCARYSNSNSPAQTFFRDQERDYVSLAVLTFDYGGTVIQPSDPCTEFQDSTGRVVKRDVQQETFYVSRLYKAGLRVICRGSAEPQDTFEVGRVNPRRDWIRFVAKELPMLVSEGFGIEFDRTFPFRIVQVDSWKITINRASPTTFFTRITVSVESEELSLLPLLFAETSSTSAGPEGALERLESVGQTYLRVPNGRCVGLPSDLVRLIFFLIRTNSCDQFDSQGWSTCNALQALALVRSHLTKNIEFCGNAIAFLRGCAMRCANDQGLEASSALEADERVPLWMDFIREAELGGLIDRGMVHGRAEELCLNQIIADKRNGLMSAPALLICSQTKLSQWFDYIRVAVPDLNVIELCAEAQRPDPDLTAILASDLVIVRYSLLTRRAYLLQRVRWHLLLLDRLDSIETRSSQAVKLIGVLEAKYRLSVMDAGVHRNPQKLSFHFEAVFPGVYSGRALDQLLLTSEVGRQRRAVFIESLEPFFFGSRSLLNEMPGKAGRMLEFEKIERNMSIICDVLLTNLPMKIVAAKYGLRNVGSLSIVHMFCYKTASKGEPTWGQWRLNRRNRSARDRDLLVAALRKFFKVADFEFDGLLSDPHVENEGTDEDGQTE